MALAREEAVALARAIVAQATLGDPDAELEELGERLEAELEVIWPEEAPVEGYELHSSLGALLVARAALELVPSGRRSLRRKPLDRAGMIAALVKQGVDGAAAEATIGDWQEVWPDFSARPEGLSAAMIAGLSERSLTRKERDQALCQVAYSPRCLVRLAASCNLLGTVRALLASQPPAALGDAALLANAAVALGVPGRGLELLAQPEAPTLRQQARWELLFAQQELSEGRAPALPEDPWVRLPAEGGPAEGEEGAEEDEDDVLEMVEEGAPAPSMILPPRWGLSPEETASAEEIEAWNARRRAAGGMLSQRGSLLGVLPGPQPLTVRPQPLGPDLRLMRQRAEGGEEASEAEALILEGAEAELLLPPLRGAIRMVVAAAEGRLPPPSALSQSGGYGWLVQRAQALAHVVQGELQAAERAAWDLGPGGSPELRWAQDRLARFGSRKPAPVEPAEARQMAAGLVADLHLQLALSVAATTPSDEAQGDAGAEAGDG